jgi:hypothetical protein
MGQGRGLPRKIPVEEAFGPRLYSRKQRLTR